MLITNLAGCGNGNQNVSQNTIVNSASDAVYNDFNKSFNLVINGVNVSYCMFILPLILYQLYL